MGASTSTPSKPSIQDVLHHYSNRISANSDYIREGNKIANEVFNILRSERNDVDRVIVAGSIGKRTAVGDGSDFDVVIFLNKKEPPFKTTLAEIRAVLQRQKSKLKNYKCLNETDMFVSFEVSGYQFDLSPAANYRGWLSSSQKDATWKKIKELPNPVIHGRLYSPGLSEYAVEFLKQQSSFVHSVIRLAKYWNAKLDVGRCYIGGRSLMMELIAIKACEKVSKTDLYLAFKQFLMDVANFDELMIYFENYYYKSEIPTAILQYGGPVILDPVNYYNNLGHRRNIPERAVTIFERAANNSLTQLERWMQDPNATSQTFRNSGIFYDDGEDEVEEEEDDYYDDDDY